MMAPMTDEEQQLGAAERTRWPPPPAGQPPLPGERGYGPDGDYLHDAGLIIQEERFQRGFTAEQAAKKAKVAYKTWLRIESGKPVRNLTWNGVDRLFGLPPGTTRNINDTDELKSVLARNYEETVERMGAPPRQVSGSASLSASGSLAVGSGHATAPSAHASGEGTVSGPPLADRIRGLDLEGLRRLRDMVDAAIVVHQEAAELGDGAVEYGAGLMLLRRLDALAQSVRNSTDTSDDPDAITQAEQSLSQAKKAFERIRHRHPEFHQMDESIPNFEGSLDDLADVLMNMLRQREEWEKNGEH